MSFLHALTDIHDTNGTPNILVKMAGCHLKDGWTKTFELTQCIQCSMDVVLFLVCMKWMNIFCF